MLVLKKIDVYGQIACFCIALVLVISQYRCSMLFDKSLPVCFLSFFIVGGWQLISAVIHKICCGRQIVSRYRTNYNKVLLAILLFATLSIFAPFLVGILAIGLLYLSPIMAIWYIRFSYKELQIWEAKAFIHLK